MANTFYNPSGNPATGSEGLSALMRGEFLSIGVAFDLMPRISTTGAFNTVFAQTGSYTFTLPAAPGTLAMMSDITAATTTAAVLARMLTALNTLPTSPQALVGWWNDGGRFVYS